jgi:hypothetical protein
MEGSLDDQTAKAALSAAAKGQAQVQLWAQKLVQQGLEQPSSVVEAS